MTGITKIVHLYRGAQDGMEIHTTEELHEDEVFWVPSPDLLETIPGKSFHEIQDILEDPDNECYLPYHSHLIAYLMEEEWESESGKAVFLYGEDPELTHARIEARKHYEREY